MKYDLIVLGVCMCLILFAVQWGQRAEDVSACLPNQEGKVLILDAGHGGEDGGTSSAAGDKESDINLGIIQKLEQILGFCGVQTLLTRSQDISIHDASAQSIREKKVSDLKNRVALIEQRGKALLSVHQNAYPDSRYSGAQVFYGHSDGSESWAACTQEMLRISLNPENSRQARPIAKEIYLMNQVTCPAILAECGFLSNGVDASLLITPIYQRKVALALAGAYLQFCQIVSTYTQ